MKIELTEKEIQEIIYLIEGEYENGKRVMVENPCASLLIEEWKKTLGFYERILKKLKTKQGDADGK